MPSSEERDLGVDQFPALNEAFYASEPYVYFHQRLNGLLLNVSNSPHVQDAFRDGISYGKMRAYGQSAISPEQSRDFALTESVILLHHASEALLRLYFAHAKRSPCPWLEVARLRSFKEFKVLLAELRDSIDSDVTIDSLRWVFRGTTDAKEYDFSTQAWKDDGEGLQLLISEAARHLLDESDMYNAAKHGLALLSRDVGFEFQMDGLYASNEGPSLTYLQIRNGSHGRCWNETTTFVNAESHMALTQLLLVQMQSLWSVARANYRDDLSGQFMLLNPRLVEEVARGYWKKPLHLPGVSRALHYSAIPSNPKR